MINRMTPEERATFDAEFKASCIVREIARMKTILADGLNPVYDDFNDFLHDYWPDFSWNKAAIDEYKTLLATPEWSTLAAEVKAKHGFDFVTEVTNAITVLTEMYTAEGAL